MEPTIAEQFSEATKSAFNQPGGPAVKPVVAEATPAAPEVQVETPPTPETDQKPVIESQAAPGEPRELTDEEFNAQLAKRTKGKIKSLSDLDEPAPAKTQEEIEAAQKERKKLSLSWAIANDLVKQEEYDRSIVVGAKTDREVAMELFSADALEIDPSLSAEEIEERFADHYREDLLADDPVRKLHIKKMTRDVAQYRKEVSEKVGGVEEKYDGYIAGEQTMKTFNKQVNAVLKDELPKNIDFEFTIQGPDGKPAVIKLPYTIDEKMVESMRKSYVGNKDFYNAVKGNKKELSNADIMGAVMYDLKANAFDAAIPALMADAATKAVKDWVAFNKVIPHRNINVTSSAPDTTPAAQRQNAQQFSEATKGAFKSVYNN